MWDWTFLDPPLPPLAWAVVLGASLVAAVTDARARRIPNVLALPVLAAGLAHGALGGGWAGLGEAGAACLALALPYVLLFCFAGGGAGDAKLMGALGAWLGLAWGAVTLVMVCLAGVALALAWSAAHRRLRPLLAGLSHLLRGAVLPFFGTGSLRDLPTLLPPTDDGDKLPYGLAIAAGTVLAFGGAWLRAG